MSRTSHLPGTVLITGAADRIGAAIAKRLALAGWAVIVHYRGSEEAARAVVRDIEQQGGRAGLVQADLADRAQRAGLVAQAAQVFGPLTALINNASIFKPDAVLDLDETLWDAHFAVHAEAPLFLVRDFAAQLPQGVQGNIVNVIDERVLHLSPAFLSYTLSKAVLWTATQTLAQSLAPAIRVNAIGPGPTLRHEGQSQAEFERSIDKLLLKRGATPEDIAAAVLFIFSAPALTGQMLALDGGKHLDYPERRAPTPRQQ